jgi:hypothetical protein
VPPSRLYTPPGGRIRCLLGRPADKKASPSKRQQHCSRNQTQPATAAAASFIYHRSRSIDPFVFNGTNRDSRARRRCCLPFARHGTGPHVHAAPSSPVPVVVDRVRHDVTFATSWFMSPSATAHLHQKKTPLVRRAVLRTALPYIASASHKVRLQSQRKSLKGRCFGFTLLLPTCT